MPDMLEKLRAYVNEAKVPTCGYGLGTGPYVTIEMPDGSQAFIGLMDVAKEFIALAGGASVAARQDTLRQTTMTTLPPAPTGEAECKCK